MKTNAAIREAFARLAAQGDFRKISITALAAEANIDRKTFYLHYQSVDDLIEEIVREETQAMVEDLKKSLQAIDGPVTSTDLLRALISWTPKKLEHTTGFAKHASMEDFIDHLEKPLGDVLVGLRKEHSPLSQRDEIRLRYSVSFMVAGSLAMYKRWLTEKSDLTLDELSEISRVVTFTGMAGLAYDLARDTNSSSNPGASN